MLAQHGGLLQIEDMAAVQDIEAAIGKDDGIAFLLPLAYLCSRFFPAQCLVRMPVGRLPFLPQLEQFVAMDGISPDLGDDDTGCGIGDLQARADR